MTSLDPFLRTSLFVLVSSALGGCPTRTDSEDLFAPSSDGGVELTPGSAANVTGLPAARPDETFTLNHVVFEDQCGTTAADRCDECEINQRVSVNDCWNTCYGAQSAGIFQNCASICGDLDRSDRCDYACEGIDEKKCLSRTYEFTVAGKRDANVEAACREAVLRDASCGETNVGTACEVVAHVERPAVVAAYACVAEAPCGESVDESYEPLGGFDFSLEVMGACEREALSDSLVNWLDIASGWLRPTALDDVAICERLCGTGDYAECVELWLTAVTGQ